MRPIKFEGENWTMNFPEHEGSEAYSTYSGFKFLNNLGTNCLVTMWQPNKEDIDAILSGKPVILLQLGASFNRVHLYTIEENG